MGGALRTRPWGRTLWN